MKKVDKIRIIVPPFTVKEMAKETGKLPAFISRALKYDADTPLQREIRQLALDKYNGRIVKIKMA